MNAKLCSVSLSSNSELITQHFFEWRRGWAFESRALKLLALLQRGPAPSYAPHAGDTSPAIPLVRIPSSVLSCSPTLLPLTLYASRFTFHVFNWRRGWDSNPRSHCWDACFPSMSIRPLSHLSALILRGGILTRGLVTSKVTASAPHSNPARLSRLLSSVAK